MTRRTTVDHLPEIHIDSGRRCMHVCVCVRLCVYDTSNSAEIMLRSVTYTNFKQFFAVFPFTIAKGHTGFVARNFKFHARCNHQTNMI